MDAVHVEAHALIGTFRRFGEVGPFYEITGIGNPDGEGRPQMSILVVESGETLDYPLSDILEDPQEA